MGSSSNIDARNCGVYLAIMKLLARDVPQLERHLSSGNRVKYLSNTVMEEEIATFAKISRQKILQGTFYVKLDHPER
jgi:hypothetical protein